MHTSGCVHLIAFLRLGKGAKSVFGSYAIPGFVLAYLLNNLISISSKQPFLGPAKDRGERNPVCLAAEHSCFVYLKCWSQLKNDLLCALEVESACVSS